MRSGWWRWRWNRAGPARLERATCSLGDMVKRLPSPAPVPASAIVQEMLALGITHVINVPDTHQRTLLAALARQSQMRVADRLHRGRGHRHQRRAVDRRAAADAVDPAGGLAGGAEQCQGHRHGRAHPDVHAGRLLRARRHPHRARQSRRARSISSSRRSTPGASPYFPIEVAADLPAIGSAYRHSLEHLGPSVILVGAPTS